MFTFAMITGVKQGWLDEKTYGPAACKAWLALVGYLNEDGAVREVCMGMDKEPMRSVTSKPGAPLAIFTGRRQSSGAPRRC